jgi:hypothetical protein
MTNRKMRLDLMGTRLSMPELLTITLKLVKLVDSFHKQHEVIGWLNPKRCAEVGNREISPLRIYSSSLV